MKKHAIIPIFIPHKGCPNDCVFCNQRKITAKTSDVTPEDVKNIIEKYLKTLKGRGLSTIEVAFFGGSFTGIPMDEQSALLSVAFAYKKAGKIDYIHLSTRPDYINSKILDNLKDYGVDVIELGVQSFDEKVLRLCKRGHTAGNVESACRLIHDYGFTLGIQLMIGLPGDSMETCIASARKAVSLKPSIARLYPTVVIAETELAEMYKRGDYRALTTEEAVAITKEMYRILTAAKVKVIRVGLKSTDLISNQGTNNTVLADYHPSFRQLVESELARESIEQQLKDLLTKVEYGAPLSICCVSAPRLVSAMSGYKGSNRNLWHEKYPNVHFIFRGDESLEDGYFKLEKL